jgi:hypothetical protein
MPGFVDEWGSYYCTICRSIKKTASFEDSLFVLITFFIVPLFCC